MSNTVSANTPAGDESLSFGHLGRSSLACGIISLDGQNKVVTQSPNVASMLGRSDPRAPLAFERLPPPLQALVAEVRSSGQPLVSKEIRVACPERGAVALQVDAAALAIGQAEPGVTLVVRDLTALGRLEPHLRRLDRLAHLGTMTAGLAHEIKNALVAGRTFIDLLIEKQQDTDLAEIVRKELGRIDGMVSRMLRFAGPARAAFASVSLHEVLDHSLRLVQAQVESKLITLERSFGAAQDLVRGHDYELQQAFVNLLLNAVEAMDANGRLQVTTELTTNPSSQPGPWPEPDATLQIRVRIQDTGPGIPPEHLRRLFEPFFTTKTDGTGLGLAITRGIVLEHHGAIAVESAPGQGATFEICLPVIG